MILVFHFLHAVSYIKILYISDIFNLQYFIISKFDNFFFISRPIKYKQASKVQFWQ